MALLNLYFFSRFTVDDAFITWRYGKNLIDNGIWGYNPTTFDITQAYTNPAYAFLSIIPAYFNVDMVLFFKIFSVMWLALSGAILVFISDDKRKSLALFLLFLCVPATTIHAFSGLETYLYATTLGFLFVFIYKRSVLWSTLASSALFLIRPEAWTLVFLTPLYLATTEYSSFERNYTFRKTEGQLNRFSRNAFYSFIFLAIFLCTYFYLHYQYFGFALPNTFYIKSGKGIQLFTLISLLFYASLSLALVFTKRINVLVFILAYSLPIIYSYSTSSLQMDYAGRFAFHIFAPLYIFFTYISSSQKGHLFISHDPSFYDYKKISYSSIIHIALFVFLSLFALKTSSPSSLVHIANYYPRALDSHAKLGKALRDIKLKYRLSSFSFGDAGMAAFHSNMIALDNIGLGSSLVAHNGVSKSVIELYSPNVIIFHSTPEGIRYNDHGQINLYKYALSKNYNLTGEVYWKKDYTLRVYTKSSYANIRVLASSSKESNNISDKEYWIRQSRFMPWYYWHE